MRAGCIELTLDYAEQEEDGQQPNQLLSQEAAAEMSQVSAA
jgi:hypothetical protein